MMINIDKTKSNKKEARIKRDLTSCLKALNFRHAYCHPSCQVQLVGRVFGVVDRIRWFC